MGFLLSKSMDANLKKQQEFMLHNARLQVSRAGVRHLHAYVFKNILCHTSRIKAGAWSSWFRFYLITLALYSLFTPFGSVQVMIGVLKAQQKLKKKQTQYSILSNKPPLLPLHATCLTVWWNELDSPLSCGPLAHVAVGSAVLSLCRSAVLSFDNMVEQVLRLHRGKHTGKRSKWPFYALIVKTQSAPWQKCLGVL